MRYCGDQYYYGSYGLVRGYGRLCKTLKDADADVYADSAKQRRNGGCSDRYIVLVSRETGLCWCLEEGDIRDEDLMPVRDSHGTQVRYPVDGIRACEVLWEGPVEMAGFA